MAEILLNVSNFSRENGPEMPNDPAASIAGEQVSQMVSLPPNFLTFYQRIISMISDVQKSLEDQNFNRMARYVVTINDAIVKYFKASGEDVLRSKVEAMSKSMLDKTKSGIERMQRKGVLASVVESEILGVVEEYKEKILDEIRSLVVSGTVSKEDGDSKRSKMTMADVDRNVEVANELLQRKEEEYRTEMLRFSANLGMTMVSKIKDITLKLNEYNLSKFRKNMKALERSYDRNFFGIVRSAEDAEERNRLTLKRVVGVQLGNLVKGSLGAATLYLHYQITKFMLGLSVAKVFLFWAGKAWGAAKAAVGFGISVVSTSLRALGAVAKSVVGAVSFGLGAIGKVVTLSYSLSRDIAEKIVGIDVTKFFGNAMKAFIFSYPGAYFLGYALGRIWRMTLRFAGISDADIASGDFSISDDIVKPFIEEKILKPFNNLQELFDSFFNSDGEGSLEFLKNKYKAEIQKTNVYKRIDKIVKNIKKANWRERWDKLTTVAMASKILYEKYMAPVIRTIWSLVGVFAEGWISEPRLARRASLSMSASARALRMSGMMGSFYKGTKAAGGMKAAAVGLLALGIGTVLGQVKEKTIKGKDQNKTVTLGISERYAKLYEKNGEEREDIASLFEDGGISKRLDRKLSGLERLIASEDESKRKENVSAYKSVHRIYLDLLEEQDSLERNNEKLTEFENIVKENLGYDVPNDLLSNFANDILSYNGHSLISGKLSDYGGVSTQIRLLRGVLAQRLSDNGERIANLEKLLDDARTGRNGLSSMLDVFDEIGKRQIYLPESISLLQFDMDAFNPKSPEGSVSFSLFPMFGNVPRYNQTLEDDERKSKIFDAFHSGSMKMSVAMRSSNLFSGQSMSEALSFEGKSEIARNAGLLEDIASKKTADFSKFIYKDREIRKQYFNFIRNDPYISQQTISVPDFQPTYGYGNDGMQFQSDYSYVKKRIGDLTDSEFNQFFWETLTPERIFAFIFHQRRSSEDAVAKNQATQFQKDVAKFTKYYKRTIDMIEIDRRGLAIPARVQLLIQAVSGLVFSFFRNFLSDIGNVDFFKVLDVSVRNSFIKRFEDFAVGEIMKFGKEENLTGFLERIKGDNGIFEIADEIFSKSIHAAIRGFTDVENPEGLVKQVEEFYGAADYSKKNRELYDKYLMQKKTNEELLEKVNGLLEDLSKKASLDERRNAEKVTWHG